MAGFAGGRIQTAARAVGVMQAAFEEALEYAHQRRTFGRPIGDYQLIRIKLARMASLLHGTRVYTYSAAPLMDRGVGDVAASMAKLLASRAAEWVSREAMQIHGGMGYAEESAVSRYFVDARGAVDLRGKRRDPGSEGHRPIAARRLGGSGAGGAFLRILLGKMPELSPSVAIDLERVRRPSYGRTLEDFRPGQVFEHPRGFTFRASDSRAFATTFMQANPLYLNSEYARSLGYRDCPASAQMVFNVVLSLGVENDSEKAMANLGYYQAQFLRPVYAGDTLRAATEVVERRDRGDKPGIVHVRTLGLNQSDEVVLQYERKIMVRRRGPDAEAGTEPQSAFPWIDDPDADLPLFETLPEADWQTGGSPRFEDFEVGQIFVHANGRTVTDEHIPWTYRVANTHPLHYDRLYSSAQEGPLSGEPVVYGGLVFAWLDGLASRDLASNAVWELGFTEGYHTQPTFSGDTLTAISRVLACEPVAKQLGAVTFQLIGLKNLRSTDALERFGEALFEKENGKARAERIPEKVFEIERRLLLT